MERYSVITEKNPREILLLRGSGCKWRRCRFCDYHLDFSKNEEENFELNKEVLSKVTGVYGKLEVINSGSFIDLDPKTMALILQVCKDKGIDQIHFECHYLDRSGIPAIRKMFEDAGIKVKIKLGVETFDAQYRENELVKGIDEEDPAVIAEDFDECCLLFGLKGQNAQTMSHDVKTGLENFDRVCINIMVENGMPVKPDAAVIKEFMQEIYPEYENNDRVDILLNNTDFGVGAPDEDKAALAQDGTVDCRHFMNRDGLIGGCDNE